MLAFMKESSNFTLGELAQLASPGQPYTYSCLYLSALVIARVSDCVLSTNFHKMSSGQVIRRQRQLEMGIVDWIYEKLKYSIIFQTMLIALTGIATFSFLVSRASSFGWFVAYRIAVGFFAGGTSGYTYFYLCYGINTYKSDISWWISKISKWILVTKISGRNILNRHTSVHPRLQFRIFRRRT